MDGRSTDVLVSVCRVVSKVLLFNSIIFKLLMVLVSKIYISAQLSCKSGIMNSGSSFSIFLILKICNSWILDTNVSILAMKYTKLVFYCVFSVAKATLEIALSVR